MQAWQVSVFRTGRAQLRAAGARPPPGIALSARAWCALTSKLQRLLMLVSHTLRLPPHAAPAPATAAPAPVTAAAGTLAAADDAETEGWEGSGAGAGDGAAAGAGAGEGAGGEPPRLLIYTQWLAHVKYVAQLLRRAGVPCLALGGSLEECMGSLARFGSAGAPRVLVLSSQHHASGINLQCATNLIVLHPYCTPTAAEPADISYKQLLAYEAQAVGRIRRYPQTRCVHVYRIYAQGTIEEALYAAQGSRRQQLN